MLLRQIWPSAGCARRVAPLVPLPDEIVERVLLSPDLVPHILAPLKAEDGAAAAVCSQWLAGWKETNEPRRRLKEVPFDLPEELHTAGDPLCSLHVAATLDGRLVASAFTKRKLHILDLNMRVLQSVTRERELGSGAYQSVVAADDHSVYCTARSHQPGTSVVMLRTSFDGTFAAEYDFHEGHDFVNLPVLAGGLLFCVMSTWKFQNGGDRQLEIFALDAQTMQLRHRFGRGLLGELYVAETAHPIAVGGDGVATVWRRCVAVGGGGVPLAVGGDELYASVADQDCLQVFSLTGVHRRSVRGDWRMPSHLCVENDRVYLVAAQTADDDGCGTRSLLVLSKHGEVLQVYTHSLWSWQFRSIMCFDGKLLVSYSTRYNHYPRNYEEYRRRHGLRRLSALSLRHGAFALQLL